jgi:ankyrin repeat protein
VEPAAAIDDRDARLLAGIRRGAEADVRALLKKGANPNARDEKLGFSALTLAINSGFPALVEMLVEAGADVNERDARNRTRLEYAIDKYTVARFVRTSLSDKHAAPYAKKIAGIIAAAPRLSAAMKASTGAAIADHARKAGLDEIADTLARHTAAGTAAVAGSAVDIEAH